MLASPFVVNASPQQDLKDFRSFFKKKFPDTPMNDFINGVYSVHKASRDKDGKGFKDCFPNAKRGIKGNYPYFDTKTGKVFSLEGTINKCITSHGS